MTIRVLLYNKRPPARVPQQPNQPVNLNVGTLAAAATTYFLNDTCVRVLARKVQQPDQPNGMIQRLTFVPPTIPFNQYNWPNPVRLKAIPQRWNTTNQGQNPELIPPAVAASVTGFGAGSPAWMGRMMTRG